MKGSCLCGKVKYEVKVFESEIANCFCKMCQKNSGSAYSTYGSVLSKNFQWLAGNVYIGTYKSSVLAERGFCKNCGSSLYYRLLNGSSGYEVALGTLDEEPNTQPNANIFCNSQAQWSKNNSQLHNFSHDRIRF